MNNLHISMAEFKYASRILKETNSIKSIGLFDNIYIAALYSKGLPEEEIIEDNILLKRFRLSSKKISKGFLGQIVKYIELLLKLYKFYKIKDISVINIHHLALLPIGYILKIRFKTKLIYDAHELETETNGLSRSKFRKYLAKILERIFIYKCDNIIVVSESIAEHYKKKYNIKKPLVILNLPKYCSISKKDLFRETFDIKQKSIIFLYQGALSKGRGIELILETFKSLQNIEYVVVFMGYGEFEEKIIEYSKESKNIFFQKAVSPNVVLEYTSSADIGLSLIENTCLSYYYCLPNKMFEYLMVGLPIIVSNMKEMSSFIDKYEVGEILLENNIKEFKLLINKIKIEKLILYKKRSIEISKSLCWEEQESILKNLYIKLAQ